MNRGDLAGPGSDTAPRRYRFPSTWRLHATPAAVWDVLAELVDGPDPFAWWPDLDVTGRDADEVHVVTRSGAGYRLRFRLHDLRTDPSRTIAFRADGDLVGEGRVEVAEEDGRAVLHITWDVDATRAWMRVAGPVLRPLFVVTHALVMRRGRRALDRWLRLVGPGPRWE